MHRTARLALFILLFLACQAVSAMAETNFVFDDAPMEALPEIHVAAATTGEAVPTGEVAATGEAGQADTPSGPLSYWTAKHGEAEGAALWEIMMQPITIYDGGLDQRSHVYLMENPDGSGAKIAQVHAQSQGIYCLGEPNEHGYVLAQTYSSFDDEYQPASEADFGLKQGYIKASGLKEIAVRTDYALLIDKLTQRLYIYAEGQAVAELKVSTGLVQDDKLYRETPAGEFITVSHVGPFSTHKYMKSDMAIRISGGILIHEVPYEPLGDGSRRYSGYEALLGGKASAGCIRVQREATPEGYNQRWIWDNFEPSAPYKVIIWDDVGR